MKTEKDGARKFMKTLRRIDTIGCVLLLIVIAGIAVSFIGFPKTLDETVKACVYTEKGETIPCEIQIKGEVTTYPFRSNAEYTFGAYRDHILITQMQYNTGKSQYGYSKSYRSTGIKDIRRDVLIVEMDLHTLFPELEKQRCMLVAPALEPGEAMEIVNNAGDYEEFKAPFAWVMGE